MEKILLNLINFISYSLDQRSAIKKHHKVEEDAGQEEVDAAATQPGQLQDGGQETGTGDRDRDRVIQYLSKHWSKSTLFTGKFH